MCSTYSCADAVLTHVRMHAHTYVINTIITSNASINIMTEQISVRVKEVSFQRNRERLNDFLPLTVLAAVVCAACTRLHGEPG